MQARTPCTSTKESDRRSRKDSKQKQAPRKNRMFKKEDRIRERKQDSLSRMLTQFSLHQRRGWKIRKCRVNLAICVSCPRFHQERHWDSTAFTPKHARTHFEIVQRIASESGHSTRDRKFESGRFSVCAFAAAEFLKSPCSPDSSPARTAAKLKDAARSGRRAYKSSKARIVAIRSAGEEDPDNQSDFTIQEQGATRINCGQPPNRRIWARESWFYFSWFYPSIVRTVIQSPKLFLIPFPNF